MSDLNDFFAKKDRKKKRAAAAKSAQLAAAQESAIAATESNGDSVPVVSTTTTKTNAPPSAPTATATSVPPQPPKPDDGWIEIEDVRGSQVNTGGRTVVEFRRDTEEKEVNGENTTQSEKFSGWAKADSTEQDGAEEETNTTAAPLKQPDTAFPSLADAAKVPHVVAPSKSSTTSTTQRQRPRFVLDKEKFRKKLEESMGNPSS